MTHARATGPAPGDDAVSNGALRLALQKCEGKRLGVLLLLIALTAAITELRHVLGGRVMQGRAFVDALILLGAVGAYAIILLLIVRRANARNRLLPLWLWVVTTVVETSIPTAAMLILQLTGRIPMIEALSVPAVVMYGALIALSILRMRAWLTMLSGFVAAAGHAALIAHAAVASHGALHVSDLAFLLSYPVNLLLTGLASSLVTSEVRKYFLSSLREAATRRSLERIQDEMEMARAVQQGLMPAKPPEVPGFEIAGWNRPADRTGGDYFDWQVLPDGRVAVVIADVSGHGLGPALLMTVCRAYARACVPLGPELGSSLRRVNALLHEDVRSGRFVTLAIVLLDGKTGECELLSAGHGPLLLLRDGAGGVERFEGDGLPLGILDDEDFGAPRRFTLNRGDVLLLVTDGFIEWARGGDGELYGEERLAACLTANSRIGATELIEVLARDVESFAGDTPQPDDMTAVAIRRL